MNANVSIGKMSLTTKTQQLRTSIITKDNKKEFLYKDQKVRIPQRLSRKEQLLSEV